jgi:hypothetical protein
MYWIYLQVNAIVTDFLRLRQCSISKYYNMDNSYRDWSD